MRNDELLILIVLVAPAALGIVLYTGRLSQFNAGGRAANPIWNGAAIAATVLLPLALLTGTSAADRSWGLMLALCAAVGLVLSAISIAPLLRAFGGYTVADFIGERFGGSASRLAATLLVVVVTFPLLVVSLSVLGAEVADVLKLDRVMGILIAAGLMLLSATFGGSRAVGAVERLQALVIVAALLAAAAAVSFRGGVSLQAAPVFASSEDFDRAAAAVAVIAGAASLPQVLAAGFLTATARDSALSFLYAALFIAATTLFGLILPQQIEFWSNPESGTSSIVGVAAAIASAVAALAAIATTLANDFYLKTQDDAATATTQLIAGRVSMVVVMALAAFLAMETRSSLVVLAASCFSLAASTLFPALVLGLWWRRANKAGALAGMGAGFGLCVAYFWLPLSWWEIRPEFAAIYALPLSAAVIIAVSLLTPPPPQDIQDFTVELRRGAKE
jgi:cation/acetate symporter